ncbi:MAG: hypothetical protein ACRD2X_13250 [Vicinamibacteraceae bacterium]
MNRSYLAFFTASLVCMVSTLFVAPGAGGQTIDAVLRETTHLDERDMRSGLSGARGRSAAAIAVGRGRVFADGDLNKALGRLLAGSEIFRNRYARVVRAGLIVAISYRVPVQYVRLRAVTTIVRHDGRLHRAIVRIKPGHNPVELIAHEFEHIVEQLEGVRYRDDLRSARGGTRVTAGDAFETNRAMAAGLLAVRQVRESERDRKRVARLARAF